MADRALTESKDGVLLAVHVQPGAGVTGIVGRHGDAVKIRVGAPPADGRANAAVTALVAREFGIEADATTLAGGQKSAAKKVRLADLDLETAERLLEVVLQRAATGR